MSNPWLKKNPWLSVWLSGANAVASQARAQGAAEARRAVDRGVKDATAFWTDVWFPKAPLPAPPRKRRKR